ncbi:hypothetical protein Agabi119p4_9000 [Agaricus bisporus var. burnettii]|uniref:Fungal-type protein kinase domain-containing protein n=1 Tax=Agaricus bisporus var. burnettii TaxID=192524 RepID=A0A8H7C4I3_AGABI|nr:hypothetical protein Agabi119p4_9000 [Agaricus bisporus var. burnettii]
MVDEILECNLEDFLAHYAPWEVPAPTVESVYDLYVADNERHPPLVKKMEQDHEDTAPSGLVFADFEIEPTKCTSSEPSVLKDLKDIVDSLCEQKVESQLREIHRTPALCYKDCPYDAMSSEIKGTNIRVDACLTERPEGRLEHGDYRDPNPDGVDLADVAVAAEFKKHYKDRIQNRHQLVADASQILNNDPRRTWMYGFTIENTMMSIWYFSRSHTVVSTPFDFTKDIKSFIHVFLSLLYATREEIGYDPTVHRVLHKDKIQYVYEVVSEGETRYFRTKKTLFTSRVLSITGRKTRVWKAVEVEGYENEQYRKEKVRGKEVALKDCWLGEGSRTEKDNLSAIFERLEAVKEKVKDDPKILDWADPSGNRQLFEDLLDTGNYKGYFMEIECDTKLAITKARLPTAQPVPDFLVPLEREETSSGNAGPQSTQTTQSLLEMAHQRRNAQQDRLKPSTPREYRAKQHYRLIYKEVGRPLHAATNLGSSLQGLADTLIALTLLYLAGYVHRDVSIGNIILVDSSDGVPRGKLSDLEYAKVFQEGEPSADPKTGTLFFMAYEIHAGRVLYQPPRVVSRKLTPRTGHVVPPATSTRWLRPKFRFTHDLESLLWVTLYVLAKYLPQDERSRKFLDKIYVPTSNPSREREDLITMGPQAFQHYLEGHLHSKIACFSESLAHYQNVLGWSYTDEYSMDNMLNHATYDLLYDITHQAFSGIKTAFDSGNVPNFEFTHNAGAQQRTLPPESRRKRPRTQGEGEDDDYVPVEQDLLPDRQPVRKQPKRGKTMSSLQSHVIIS